MRWLPKDGGASRKHGAGSIISGLLLIVPLLIPGDTDPYHDYFALMGLAIL